MNPNFITDFYFYWGDSSWAFPFLENKPMTILQIMKLLHHSQGYNQYTFIQKYRIPTLVTVVWTGTGRKCGKTKEDGGHSWRPQCPRRESQRSWGRGNRGGGHAVSREGDGFYSSMIQQGQQQWFVLASASMCPSGCCRPGCTICSWNCRSTTAAAEGALALRSLLIKQEPFLSCTGLFS